VGSPTVALINEMNPVIRGWSNYSRIGVASKVFSNLGTTSCNYRAHAHEAPPPTEIRLVENHEVWGHTIGPRQDRWVFLDKVRPATSEFA